MPHDQQTLIGIVAGMITFAASVRYWIAIYRGDARPNRASYVIWTLLHSVIAITYVLGGARRSAIVPIALALSLYPVVPLAIWSGHYERGWSCLDKACLALAGLGLVFWATSGSAPLTLIWMMSIDTVAALPTIRKAWAEPESEDQAAWSIVTVGQALNLAAVEEWRFEILIYPLVSVAVCLVIVLPLLRSRGRKIVSV